MIDPITFVAFLAASAAIVIAPGPAQALTLARTLGDGRRAGVMTALGLNVGTVAHALAAALGLSAVLAASAVAFSVVKYLGAAYLVYLGIMALRSVGDEAAPSKVSGAGPWQVFGKAIVTGVLNPKVALFFLAFLPQFVDPAKPVFWQFLALGVTLAALDVVYETILALAAGSLAKWLAANPKVAVWRGRIMGGALIGLGLRLALTPRE